MKRNPDSIRKWQQKSVKKWRDNMFAKTVVDGFVNRSKTSLPKIGVRGKRLAKADAAARTECHSRSDCQLAGFDPSPCSGPVEDHHVLGRGLSSEAVRVMPENHLRSCKAHHELVHRKRAAYRVWVNATFDGLYDRLKAISNHVSLPESSQDVAVQVVPVSVIPCRVSESHQSPSDVASVSSLKGFVSEVQL